MRAVTFAKKAVLHGYSLKAEPKIISFELDPEAERRFREGVDDIMTALRGADIYDIPRDEIEDIYEETFIESLSTERLQRDVE